jgi:signal transduction histidine kinase
MEKRISFYNKLIIYKQQLLYVSRILTIAILYYITGSLSLEMSHQTEVVTIVVFAAEGIALATVLLYGKHVWIGIFLGQFLLSYHHLSLIPSLSIAMVNSVEALLAVTIFNYFKLNNKLQEIRDILGLIILIVFILQPFSSILGNLILMDFHIHNWEQYMINTFSWWFGNIMGQLLFTPMILLMYANLKKEEIMDLIILALFFATMNYFFQIVFPIHNLLLLLALTLPLILYISSDHGVHYGTFSTLAIVLVSLYLVHSNRGIFVTSTDIDNIINLNSYFLFQILLLLIIGTLFSEKRNRTKILERMVKEEVEKNRQQQLYMFQRNRLAQMGEMLSMIAHQWRQPLNNLSLINQMLILKFHENILDDHAIQEFETDTTRQIKQMSQTITDFSNFFRPEVNSVNFDLKEVIRKVVEVLKPVVHKEGISINIACTSDIRINGYPNELGQTIINLLNNAKDALIENKITDKRIDITIQREEKYIELSIKDNAGGIPTDIITHIFDPYFSTKAKNGTGLGLYMSKIIIEEHMRGELFVLNDKEGAVFTIKLPILT